MKLFFSLALVIPQERLHYLSVTGQSTEAGLNLEKNDILAPWEYCPGSEKTLSLAIQTEPHMCNPILIHRLLWDRDKTDDQLHYWQTDQTKWDENVHSTFVMSEGGLTRVFPAVEKWIMSTSGQIDPNNSTYFSRSVLRSGSGYTFMFPQPDGTAQENESDTLSGLIAAVIPVFIKQHNFKPAIAGVHLKEEWLQLLLMAHSKDSLNCKNHEEILCYLIDDGGFVFASNHPDAQMKVGHFLGIVDPELMRKLYDDDVFNKVEDYNYKARCPKEKFISAGSRVWNTFILIPNIFGSWNLGWILDVGAWMQIKLWILGMVTWLLTLPTSLLGWSIPAELALELIDFRGCTTVHAAYYPSNRSHAVFMGQLECNNCTRWYGGSQLGQTNLFLIASSPPCFPAHCSRPVLPLIQAPVEADSGSRDCKPITHYRRRPDKCYKDYDDEGVTECSGAKGKLPNAIRSLMIFLLTLLLHAPAP